MYIHINGSEPGQFRRTTKGSPSVFFQGDSICTMSSFQMGFHSMKTFLCWNPVRRNSLEPEDVRFKLADGEERARRPNFTSQVYMYQMYDQNYTKPHHESSLTCYSIVPKTYHAASSPRSAHFSLRIPRKSPGGVREALSLDRGHASESTAESRGDSEPTQ